MTMRELCRKLNIFLKFCLKSCKKKSICLCATHCYCKEDVQNSLSCFYRDCRHFGYIPFVKNKRKNSSLTHNLTSCLY